MLVAIRVTGPHQKDQIVELTKRVANKLGPLGWKSAYGGRLPAEGIDESGLKILLSQKEPAFFILDPEKKQAYFKLGIDESYYYFIDLVEHSYLKFDKLTSASITFSTSATEVGKALKKFSERFSKSVIGDF